MDLEDERNVMLINDFKNKWFTLLSRVDASPTVDEMVLSSLNSIANLLVSHRPAVGQYDPIFDLALKLEVFECIFRWNFVFTGSDLEEFKAKELQFYDSLITGDGKYYLCHVEFALPLLATLHHCAIRSCFVVERLLVRTLNSVCAALCSDPVLAESAETVELPPFGRDDDLLFFRRCCLGLIDGNLIPSCRPNEEGDNPTRSLTSGEPTNKFTFSDLIDWPWTSEAKSNRPSSTHSSCEYGVIDKSSNIDSLFDLLAPFVFREGDLGWQSRDALLLASTYSSRDEEFSSGVVNHSSVCPVLATGLATLYAELPRRLVKDNLPESWPTLIHALDEQEQHSPKFAEFLNALEFCQSVLEVAHPLIQSSLLHYIHSGFFVSVLGFSLTSSTVEEVTTATAYLKQLILRTAKSPLLPALLRFLLTCMPEEKPGLQQTATDAPVTSEPLYMPSDEFTEKSAALGETYMDLLVSRLHSCNTLLGIVTLSLFNTIISLNCEDVMLYLVLRYLVPFRDGLLQQGWIWPESDTYARAAGNFLDLIMAYDRYENGSIVSGRKDSRSSPPITSSYGSIAELNLDDEMNPNHLEPDTSFLPPMNETSGLVNGFNGPAPQLTPHPESFQSNGVSDYQPTHMGALMPVHSESITNRKLTMKTSGGNDLVVAHSHHSPTHMHSFCVHHDLKTCLTPENWLTYVAWARETIGLRTQACSQWRLQFDHQNPTLLQLACFEQYLQQDMQHNGDRTRPSDPVSASEHRLQTLSHFKCLTAHPSSRTELAAQAGEETARTICLTVSKLDLDAELELDASSPDVPQSSSVVSNLNKETDERVSLKACTSPSTSALRPRQNTSVSSDDFESASLAAEHKPSRNAPVYTSLSDYHLSSFSSKAWSDLSNVQKIKSWYCLSYTDPDLCNFPAECAEMSSVTINPPTKFGESLCCEERSAPNLDVAALQRVSSAKDLDTFVSYLDELDCTALVSDLAKGVQSADLESYFSGSVGDTVVPQRDSNGLINPDELRASTGTIETQNSQAAQRQTRSLSQNTAQSSIPITTKEYEDPQKECNSRHTDVPLQVLESTENGANLSSGHFSGVLHRRLSHYSNEQTIETATNRSELTANPVQDATSHSLFPSLGPFLTTILTRLENLPQNCFYANLLLTNLLSSLAAYPVPLLRAIILFVPPTAPLGETVSSQSNFKGGALRTLNAACCQLPHTVLSGIRRQLDLFSVQYAVHEKHHVGKSHTFMELIADAKLYFQASSEQPYSSAKLNGGGLPISGTIIDSLKPERPSIFRRVFSRRRRKNRNTVGTPGTESNNSATEHPSSANPTLQVEYGDSLSYTTKSPTKQFHFQWLPDTLAQNNIGLESSRRHKMQTKQSSRKRTSFIQEKISWSTIQRMVLCAVVFEEFCKELAALCIEHSVLG